MCINIISGQVIGKYFCIMKTLVSIDNLINTGF